MGHLLSYRRDHDVPQQWLGVYSPDLTSHIQFWPPRSKLFSYQDTWHPPVCPTYRLIPQIHIIVVQCWSIPIVWKPCVSVIGEYLCAQEECCTGGELLRRMRENAWRRFDTPMHKVPCTEHVPITHPFPLYDITWQNRSSFSSFQPHL